MVMTIKEGNMRWRNSGGAEEELERCIHGGANRALCARSKAHDKLNEE